MSNEIKRMNYSDGLLLKQDDLILDQNYHIKQQRLHNGSFHEWGIVDGLDIEIVPNLPQIKVKPGLALNKVLDTNTNMLISEEIWICDNHPDNPVNLESFKDGDYVYICVNYDEVPADIDSTKAGDKEIHIWERARIKATTTRPTDPRKNIMVACVRISLDESNHKVIKEDQVYYDSFIDENDEKKPKYIVRTYAISSGNTKEFGQIRVGNKERVNLPHIDGKIEDDKDGLEICSPFTNFTGKVTSDGLIASGKATVNGTLEVNANNKKALAVDQLGNVMIDTKAAISGTLSATGSMIVSGKETKLDTENVYIKGNTLTMNYDPENDKLNKNSSGISVYRGKVTDEQNVPQAKIVWNEEAESWQAGTDEKMNKLLYGPEWDTLTNGSIAVEVKDKVIKDLHKHSKLYDPNDKNTAILEINDDKVEINRDVSIAGDIKINKTIEVEIDKNNDKTQKNPTLFWNAELDEGSEVGKWQITDNKGVKYDIAYGDAWKAIANKKSADDYHHHSVLQTTDGKEAVKVLKDCDVQITKDLTVQNDLNVNNNVKVTNNVEVEGNLTVKGQTIVTNKVQQKITENTIIVNKPDDGGTILPGDSGLEVYREYGENAKLVWDEGAKKWKAGIGDDLRELPSGTQWEKLTRGKFADDLHIHKNIYSDDGVSVISVDENSDVNIDSDISANKGLSVEEDAKIKGALTVDGPVILNGDITVLGKERVIDKEIVKTNNSLILVNQYKSETSPISNEGGMEVYRGGYNKSAKIVWNELEKSWKIGIGNDLKKIPCGEEWDRLTENYMAEGMHKHSKLYDKNGNSFVALNTNGNVQIDKNAFVNGGLTVNGDFKVSGKFTVEAEKEFIEKAGIKSKDAIISLNEPGPKTEEGTEQEPQALKEGGIEIFRGEKSPKARFIWDEESKVWKAGVGENLREINPIQLYNERGDTLALSVRTTGDVDVAHDLLIGQDLTILGKLDVRGKLTRIDSSNIEISGNTITLNRFDDGNFELHKDNSRITVYRGNKEKTPNASLVWSEDPVTATGEETGRWKIGLDGAMQSFEIEPDGIANGYGYKVRNDLTIDGTGIYYHLPDNGGNMGITFGGEQWDIGKKDAAGICVNSSGFVRVGVKTVDNNKILKYPEYPLDVVGDANISDNLTVGKGITVEKDSKVKGDLSVEKNATIDRALTVKGSANVNSLTVGTDDKNVSFTSEGIEIQKKNKDSNKIDSAKILWDETSRCWKFGSGDKFVELSVDGKNKELFPIELWTPSLDRILVKTTDKGYVGIGVPSPQKELDVCGEAQISKKLSAKTIESKEYISANSYKITRVGKDKSAILKWNESDSTLEIGLENDTPKKVVTGDHTHSLLTNKAKTNTIEIPETGPIKINDNIEFDKGEISAASVSTSGNITVKGVLTAYGNTNINATLFANKGLTVSQNGITIAIDKKEYKINYDATNGWHTTTDGKVNKLCFTDDLEKLTNTDSEFSISSIMTGTNNDKKLIKIGAVDTTAIFDVSQQTNFGSKVCANKGLSAFDFVTIGTSAAKADLTVNGNSTVTGNSAITGNASITGTLTAGSTTVNGALTVTGAVQANTNGFESKIDNKTTAYLRYNSTDKVWQATKNNEAQLKTLCYMDDIAAFSDITKEISVKSDTVNNLVKITPVDSAKKINFPNATTINGVLDTYSNTNIHANLFANNCLWVQTKSPTIDALTIKGNSTVTGNIAVTGNTTVTGNSTVTGKMTVTDGIKIIAKEGIEMIASDDKIVKLSVVMNETTKKYELQFTPVADTAPDTAPDTVPDTQG